MRLDTSQLLKQSTPLLKRQKKERENIFNREISISLFSNASQFKNRFFTELAVLIGSGMDLKKSFEIILSGTTKKKDKEIIENILSAIIKGSTLSKGMEKAKIFSNYDYHSVRIGEESGSISTVLKELSSYYSKRLSQQKQIKGALTYPILVLFTTVISLVFMLYFIVPMFEDIFKRFQGGLPPITKFVIALSDSFPKYATIFSVFFILLLLLHFFYKSKIWYRSFSAYLAMRIPIAGPIIRLNYQTRYCQTLKLLSGSKVHLMEAVILIRQMIEFYPFEKALEDIKNQLANGITLSKAMEAHSIFDKKLVAMTRVAEEVNKIDVVYEQLFQQYSDELDTRIKTMNNLLEPVLIIFVGGLVALILISMYMPIFQLGTSIY